MTGAAIVFTEDKKSLPALITAATDTKAGEINVVLIGKEVDKEFAKSLGKYGANKVLIYEGENMDKITSKGYADILLGVIKELNPEFIVIMGTLIGNEVAALVGSELDASISIETLKIESLEDGLYVTRSIYGGKLTQKAKLLEEKKIIVITPGAYEEKEVGGEAEIIQKEPPQLGEEVKLVEKEEMKGEGKQLEEAEIVIGVGRGIKQKEDLQMIYELAKLLNAEVGCTRPLAADYGWFDDWIGVSGKRISPKLYLLIGASGSVQHIAGARGSKLIIAINKDGEAPIYEEADYLFVADLYQLVPEIIKQLKK